jgi:hypothetical protein
VTFWPSVGTLMCWYLVMGTELRVGKDGKTMSLQSPEYP